MLWKEYPDRCTRTCGGRSRGGRGKTRPPSFFNSPPTLLIHMGNRPSGFWEWAGIIFMYTVLLSPVLLIAYLLIGIAIGLTMQFLGM